ncbi:hypothetical protein HGL71_002374 [Escherichia coli]|nr:hypothetical protein [Escherichia coli]
MDKAGKEGPNRILYFHTDVNGAPEEMTDSDGKIVWETGYQVWGNTIQEKDHGGVEQNLRYQGQYLDRETGLHYNLHRYYDPDVGRFMVTDPIGLAGGINLYAYAPNPLSWIDPLGLCKTDSAKLIAGKITGYTRHGLNQAIGRNGGKGINIKDMLDAVQNPKKVIENANGTIKYQGKRATVVLNKDGKVVTVFGKSRGPQIWPQGTTRTGGSGSAQSNANDHGFSYNPGAIK